MALLAILKRPDKKYVRSLEEVPKDYGGFDVVDRNCLAVKMAEDDLTWATNGG